MSIGYFTQVYMKAFLIECFFAVPKILSYILLKNALRTKFSISKEHFERDQFAMGYRRDYLE